MTSKFLTGTFWGGRGGLSLDALLGSEKWFSLSSSLLENYRQSQNSFGTVLITRDPSLRTFAQ